MIFLAMSSCASVSTFCNTFEPQVVFLMAFGFCTAAGFQAFTFSAVVFSCGFAVLFGMVSLSIRINRASWDAKKPEEDEVGVGGEDAEKPEGDEVGVGGEDNVSA